MKRNREKTTKGREINVGLDFGSHWLITTSKLILINITYNSTIQI